MFPTCGLVHRNNFYPRNRLFPPRCRRADDLIEIHTRIDLDNHHERPHCNHQHYQGYNHNNHHHRPPCTQTPICHYACPRQPITNATPIDNSNTTYINNSPATAVGGGGRLLNENNDHLDRFHRDLYHANNDHRWGRRTERQIRALRDLLEHVYDVNREEMDELRWGNDHRFETIMEALRRRRAGVRLFDGFPGERYGEAERLREYVAVGGRRVGRYGRVDDGEYDDYDDDEDGIGRPIFDAPRRIRGPGRIARFGGPDGRRLG